MAITTWNNKQTRQKWCMVVNPLGLSCWRECLPECGLINLINAALMVYGCFVVLLIWPFHMTLHLNNIFVATIHVHVWLSHVNFTIHICSCKLFSGETQKGWNGKFTLITKCYYLSGFIMPMREPLTENYNIILFSTKNFVQQQINLLNLYFICTWK